MLTPSRTVMLGSYIFIDVLCVNLYFIHLFSPPYVVYCMRSASVIGSRTVGFGTPRKDVLTGFSEEGISKSLSLFEVLHGRVGKLIGGVIPASMN